MGVWSSSAWGEGDGEVVGLGGGKAMTVMMEGRRTSLEVLGGVEAALVLLR